MRNLKRALSLALASVMMMGLMVVGSSAKSVDDFSDAGQISNKTAATINTAIGIFDGYDTGDFRPDTPVTRAQMAVIVAKMLYGADVNQSNFTGTHPFTDVDAWAEGYVNLCNSLGIVVGRGNGIFDPNATVTTAEASVMLAKALGYFQNEADFADSWVLAAIAKGTQLKLYGDLNLDANAPLTRDNVSEMVFNALTKASTVEYNSTFNMYYTTNSNFANGTKFQYSETLGYKNFDLVYDDATTNYDDFGRPAVTWGTGSFREDDPVDGSPLFVSINPRNEIITAADAPDATFTAKVTSKKLYDAIGSKAFDGYTWTVYVDGENDVTGVTGDTVRDSVKNHRNESDTEFLRMAGAASVWTGNGVKTEVYVDTDKDDPTVTVVIVNTYVAEVLKVRDGKITLSNLSAGHGTGTTAKTNDEFETNVAYNEDDIVLYTYAKGDIQSVQPASKLEGTVQRVRAGTNTGVEGTGDRFTVNGTEYQYTFDVGFTSGGKKLTSENVDNNVVAYLDNSLGEGAGYVIYIDESAASYSYAYVLTVGNESGKYDNDVAKATAYARLILTDGTMVKAELDNNVASSKGLLHHLVSYTVDKNGVYSLTDKSGVAAAAPAGLVAGNSIVENGKAKVKGPGATNYVGNSETIFIVVEPDDDSYDDYDIAVYTGIKNVPDVEYDGTTVVTAATKTTSNVAKVVYIEGGEVSGSGKVYFAAADANAKLYKDSKDGDYYTIDAIVDGAKVSLKVKASSSAANKLVKYVGTANDVFTTGSGGDAYASSRTKYYVALKNIGYNSDGYVTAVTPYTALSNGDGVITSTTAGVGTLKTEDGTVGLATGGTRYAYDDKVEVGRYTVNEKSMQTSTIRTVKDDTNDNYIAVLDDNVLTGLFIIEAADGTGSGGATSGDAADVTYTASALANGNAVVNLSATRAAFVPSAATVTVTYDVYVNGTLASVNETATVPAGATSIRDTVFGLGLATSDAVTIKVTDITPSAVSVRYFLDSSTSGTEITSSMTAPTATVSTTGTTVHIQFPATVATATTATVALENATSTATNLAGQNLNTGINTDQVVVADGDDYVNVVITGTTTPAAPTYSITVPAAAALSTYGVSATDYSTDAGVNLTLTATTAAGLVDGQTTKLTAQLASNPADAYAYKVQVGDYGTAYLTDNAATDVGTITIHGANVTIAASDVTVTAVPKLAVTAAERTSASVITLTTNLEVDDTYLKADGTGITTFALGGTDIKTSISSLVIHGTKITITVADQDLTSGAVQLVLANTVAATEASSGTANANKLAATTIDITAAGAVTIS